MNMRAHKLISLTKIRDLAFALVLFFASFQTHAAEDKIADQSYRITLELETPRRFAHRYLSSTRTLELKVVPARAVEFNVSKYYDTKYIHRVIVTEQNSEVILSLQFKSRALGWMIAHQNDPWRLLVDIWPTEPLKARNLEETWVWNESTEGNTKNSADASAPLKSNPVAESLPKEEKVDFGATENHVKLGHTPSEEVIQNKPSDIDLPENFGRLDPVFRKNVSKISDLRRKLGENVGKPSEFSTALLLGEENYKSGDEKSSVSLFRRAAALSEQGFKNNDQYLTWAGESAYLTKDFDLAQDYFSVLSFYHPKSPLFWHAKLRLNDIIFLKAPKEKQKEELSKLQNNYAEIARSVEASSLIKAAAALRVLHEQKPTNAQIRPYQGILISCSSSSSFPQEFRSNCSYLIAENSVSSGDDLALADQNLQNFKKISPTDQRTNSLEDALNGKIKTKLEALAKTKDWVGWTTLEQSLRPAALDFSYKTPDLLITRAEAWETVGDLPRATQLYSLFYQRTNDEAKKLTAAAQTAYLLAQQKSQSQRVQTLLQRIQTSRLRREKGLEDKALAGVRSLALSPFRNKIALAILTEEMVASRYSERDLNALVILARSSSDDNSSDRIHEKLLAFPAKNKEETKLIQDTTLNYAETLRQRNKMNRAGELYFGVAKLPGSERVAEAAYKAGVSFARTGLLEKAKSSFELAASDLNDKRYSALASERLERMK